MISNCERAEASTVKSYDSGFSDEYLHAFSSIRSGKQLSCHILYFLKLSPGTLENLTFSDGETNQGGTLFKGGHYFPSPFHMGTLIKGGFVMYANLFMYKGNRQCFVYFY